MNSNIFESEYLYSVVLPNNWSEYELQDENNTNGFFDTTDWTGNLRITPLSVRVNNPKDFLKKEIKVETLREINWENIYGMHYSEESGNFFIYYWYLIEKQRIYICSFTINIENKLSSKNINELEKIEKILKTLKSKS
ncbi:MAG: DUF3805 domain-containing protein [Flavobacteriales bacterium]|nr:DUF3805 domain-containing protein [Flavobacteriales bacterium]